jgi:hypothetical protein
VRTYAAEGLGSLDNRARWAVDELCCFLDRSEADWTGFTVIRALGTVGGEKAVQKLQARAAEAHREDPPDSYLLQALEAAISRAFLQER